MARQARLPDRPVAGEGVDADDPDPRVGHPPQPVDDARLPLRFGQRAGHPQVARLERVEVVRRVGRRPVRVARGEAVRPPREQTAAALGVGQRRRAQAGTRQTADVGRVFAVAGRHRGRQDAGAERVRPDGRGRLRGERAEPVRPVQRRLHGGLEIDEPRRRAVGDQVVQPEVVAAEGFQKRQPAPQRSEEGVGFAGRGDRPRRAHRLPGVAVPRDRIRGRESAAEVAGEVADRGGDPQVLRFVDGGAALETEYRDRLPAGVGVAEPRLDGRQHPRVPVPEDAARQQRPVRRGAAEGPDEVGAPVGGDAAEREGEGRGAAQTRRPGRRRAQPFLHEERRLERVAQAAGQPVERPVERLRAVGQPVGPRRLHVGAGPPPHFVERPGAVRQSFEDGAERARPVRVGAGEPHVAETVEPGVRGQPDRLGVGVQRRARPERLHEPFPAPRQRVRRGLDRLEDARVSALGRRRGTGDDGVDFPAFH